MSDSNELIEAQNDLDEREQLFAIALAQSYHKKLAQSNDGKVVPDLNYAMLASNVGSEREAKEILNKASFRKSYEALAKTEFQNTRSSMLTNFNYKMAKLREVIELVTTDPDKAKEMRYTPGHMLKAIELLNSMQGHNAPEQKVMMNYNAGDAMNHMKNVTPKGDDGNDEVKALLIEYEREY